MGLLLAASVAANWHQFRGHARVTTALAAQLAAAEARGQAEIEACAATNQRVTGTVRVLEQELQNCREARGQAEIEACAATNQRVTGTVRVLEQELQNCREARGQAEIEACAATNQRVTGTVRVLEQELQNCRGQTQRIEARMALALRQRDRARSEVRDHERMRALQVEAIARDHEECARPVCRSLSDRLLGIAPER
jgi:phosphoglycolate phosphatase-like HAD superfamily hydrolase